MSSPRVTRCVNRTRVWPARCSIGWTPIATSANISGQPTCRSGIEVFGTMDGRVDLVLDGGACHGQGATTVDIAEPYWKVIREGTVTEKEIADCLKGR